VRQGRRAEFAAFGWTPEQVPDPQDLSTFERSKPDWDEARQAPHEEVLDWYRTLIALRRSTPGLSDGRLDRVAVRYDEQAGWLVIERGELRVAANLGRTEAKIDLGGGGTDVLSASDPRVVVEGLSATLPPDTAVICGPPGG